MCERVMRLQVGFLLLSLLLSTSPGAQEEAERVVRGPTRPAQVANLGPLQEGVVRTVDAVEGQRVRRGDVLLRLLDDVQEARIGLMRASAAAEGELRQAEVQAQEAEAVLARTQSRGAALGRDGMGGAAGARSPRGRARRRADGDGPPPRGAAEARTRTRNARNARHSRAVRRRRDAGRHDPRRDAGATDRPLTVADLSSLEAILYLPAKSWPRLQVGRSYRLDLSAPVARSAQGRLRHIDPVLDAASGRFRAIFVIDNPRLDLPAGTEAALDLGGIAP